MSAAAIALVEFGDWELLERTEASSDEWLSLKLVRHRESARKRNYWLGWSKAERRLARNTDARKLAEHEPEAYRAVVDFLEARP